MCFDNDDHAEMYEESIVNVRKPHRCEGCSRLIQKGEQATFGKGRFDGAFFSLYVCFDCMRMVFSIASEEIQHGCHWNESWCNPGDLRDYLADRDEPPKVLRQQSLEACKKHVEELWAEACNEKRLATA
jgi:hypothetical protein